MKTIDMKKLRKLKIGFKNDQDLSMKNYDKLETKMSANETPIEEKRTVVIELALAIHASSYGLLGATFLPSETNDENTLSVEVRFNNERIPFQESISMHGVCSYIGLEEREAHGVLSGVIEFFSTRNIPAGKLIFDTAAYCEVGSSPLIFSCIAEILLDILLNGYDKLSDQELETICDKYLQKRFVIHKN